MFSFHKPKVYRSASGCCICKAKSSSSRFTDSRKYEEDLMECFQLCERRTGEICNACVLLVKRWKKLPEGSGRHWRHVVDYRAGPGSKSLIRAKTRNKKRPKLKAEVRAVSPEAEDDISSDLSVMCVLSGPSSPNNPEWNKRKRAKSTKFHNTDAYGFIDHTIWKRKKVCCGVIFTGPGGIAIVDPRLLKPCQACSLPASTPTEPAEPTVVDKPDTGVTETVPCTAISDSSSDSGYDECSNQTTN